MKSLVVLIIVLPLIMTFDVISRITLDKSLLSSSASFDTTISFLRNLTSSCILHKPPIFTLRLILTFPVILALPKITDLWETYALPNTHAFPQTSELSQIYASSKTSAES